MTRIANGFNEQGKANVRRWLEGLTGRTDITDAELRAYFDSNEYMNFDRGENLYIEIGRFDTLSGNPERYVFDADDVQFEEAD